MSEQRPKLDSHLAAALEIESADQRAAFLDESCGTDHDLRRQVEQMLASQEQVGSFVNKPAPELEETIVPNVANDDLAGALRAGLAPTFTKHEAVVVGIAHHSVLQALGQTMAVPRVMLRDSTVEGDDPVQRPESSEIPDRNADGRYQLHGEIARGGMGAILKGRDTDLGRDLAIKVLLDDHKARPEVIQRFIEEAQISGQLQHPGIVPVYELGQLADRRPYFSMKLVKGQTLSALLAEREDPAENRGKFLGIFEQVCQTVAYAHSRCVIHRDLKPANIMVGAFGEVQVMDWGLAKVIPAEGVADEKRAHDKQQSVISARRSVGGDTPGGFDSQTQMGSVMGTPAYMPPEQALGEIDQLDRRADVFGLGAILCEILTGQPPYVDDDPVQVFRQATRGKLDDCLARLDTCGADGDLIKLARHCLEADPNDRPQDAGVLAESVTGHLESVELRLRKTEMERASAAARAVEERKRRRVTLALAVTVLLAVTLAGGGWLWRKNEVDARLAQSTRDINDALRKYAALREQAKGTNVGSGALFAQAREQAQRALTLVESGPNDEALANRVRTMQAELDGDLRDRKLLIDLEEARLAQAETVVEANRFEMERALPLYREAFRTYGLPVGVGDPAVVAERIHNRPDTVRQSAIAALDDWVTIADRQDSRSELSQQQLGWLQAVLTAAEPAEGWIKKYRLALAEQDLSKRRAALESLAKSADISQLSPSAVIRLAGRLEGVRRIADAVSLLQRARKQYPGDFWINHNLGMALINSNPPEAVRFLTAAMALRPNSPGIHLNLGNALNAQGRLDEALDRFRTAVEINPEYAAAHSSLGSTLEDMGQPDAALSELRTAVRLDPDNVAFLSNLGIVLTEMGELEAALESLQTALEIAPDNSVVQTNIGKVFIAQGELDRAAAVYKSANDTLDRLLQENPGDRVYQSWLASCHHGMAEVYLAQGDSQKAAERLQLAIDIGKELRDTNPAVPAVHASLARHYRELGEAFLVMGEPDLAAQQYRLSAEIYSQPIMQRPHYQEALAKVYLSLAEVYTGPVVYHAAWAYPPAFRPYQTKEKYEEQLATCQQANAIYERLAQQIPGNRSYRTGLALGYLVAGRLRGLLKQREETVQAFRRSVEVSEKLVRDFPSVRSHKYTLVLVYGELANLLSDGEPVLSVEQRALGIKIIEGLVEDYPQVSRYRSILVTELLNLRLTYSALRQYEDEERTLKTTKSHLDALLQYPDADKPLQRALEERWYNDYAYLLSTCPNNSIRNGELAVKYAMQACERGDWRNSGYLDTLAVAYAEAGDFEKAIEYQEQALALAKKSAPSLVPILEEHLDLFRKHKPVRKRGE